MRCALCGYLLRPAECGVVCERCPIARGCRLIRCPACGYQWPEESPLIRWLTQHRYAHAAKKEVT